MAGAAFVWTQQLSLAVASNISDIMAPLEELFLVERTGVGEDGIKVSTSPGGLTMTQATKGTPAANDSNYSFGGVTITPVPMAVTVPVAEHDLENASPAQIEELILALTEAGHQAIITKLQAAITARQTGAAHILNTYTSFEEAAVRAGKWKVKGNKAPGDVRGLVTSQAMSQLETDLVSKNLNAPITSQVAGGALFYNYAGVTLFPDVYLGNNGTHEYNLLATKRGVRIVFGGVGPRIKVLPTDDPVNVRLGMSLYVEVDIPNPLLACWVKTEV